MPSPVCGGRCPKGGWGSGCPKEDDPLPALRATFPRRRGKGMTLLVVERLTVAFPGQLAVREASFAIAPGETLALVGE